MAGWLMVGKGAATSSTPASPSARRARIARRVGSARAPNARSSSLSVSSAVAVDITIWLYESATVSTLDALAPTV